MRSRLATASPWVVLGLGAVVGVAFLTATYAAGEHVSWRAALGWACGTTALTLPFDWWGLRRQRCETESVTGPLSRAQQQDVYRAAGTGVPPSDPALHRAALDLARYRFANSVHQRAAGLATVFILFGVAVLFTVTDRSWWFAVCAILFCGALVQTVRYPSRQRRRIARLEQAASPPAHV